MLKILSYTDTGTRCKLYYNVYLENSKAPPVHTRCFFPLCKQHYRYIHSCSETEDFWDRPYKMGILLFSESGFPNCTFGFFIIIIILSIFKLGQQSVINLFNSCINLC